MVFLICLLLLWRVKLPIFRAPMQQRELASNATADAHLIAVRIEDMRDRVHLANADRAAEEDMSMMDVGVVEFAALASVAAAQRALEQVVSVKKQWAQERFVHEALDEENRKRIRELEGKVNTLTAEGERGRSEGAALTKALFEMSLKTGKTEELLKLRTYLLPYPSIARILEHHKQLGKRARAGLQAERDAAIEENQKLGSQVAAFMGQKAVTQVFYTEAAKEEISGLKARLATMEVALQAERESRQQAEGAAAANQAAAQRIEDLEARLAEKEAKTRGEEGIIENLQGQLAKADADKQWLVQELEDLRAAAVGVETPMEAPITVPHDQHNVISNLRNELEEVKGMFESSQRRLRRSTSVADETIKAFREEAKVAKTALEVAEQAGLALTKELAKKENVVKKLVTAKAKKAKELVETKTQMSQELKSKDTRVEELKKTASGLKTEVRDLQAQVPPPTPPAKAKKARRNRKKRGDAGQEDSVADEGSVGTEATVGTDAAQAQEADDKAQDEHETDHGGPFKQVPWSTHRDAASSRWFSQRGRRHRPTQDDYGF